MGIEPMSLKSDALPTKLTRHIASIRPCMLFQTIHFYFNSYKIQRHYFDLLRSVLFPIFWPLFQGDGLFSAFNDEN